MAIHSSTLAWKIPWTEEPDRLQSMGLQSRTRLSDSTHFTIQYSKWMCLTLPNIRVFKAMLLYDLWIHFNFLKHTLCQTFSILNFKVIERDRSYLLSVFRACHTTRPPYFGEGDRVDYHFISQEVFDEMQNMVRMLFMCNAQEIHGLW